MIAICHSVELKTDIRLVLKISFYKSPAGARRIYKKGEQFDVIKQSTTWCVESNVNLGCIFNLLNETNKNILQ